MTAPLVIVGAGVAGLATALALKRARIDSIVLERRPALPDAGAGIQIGPNGTHVLRRLGILDALLPFASVPRAIEVHDGPSGRRLTTLPLGPWLEQQHGAPYLVLARHQLVRSLYEACRAAAVDIRFGVDASLRRSNADRVELDTDSGGNIAASAVIAADGVWSTLRTAVSANASIVETGRVAARAVMPMPTGRSIANDAVSVWMAPAAHLVAYPVHDGTMLNVVLISTGRADAARWSAPVTAAEIAQRITAVAPALAHLAHAASDWRQWPLVTRPPLPSYARGAVALVGDAARPMQPYLAQGAVMALEDAEALAHACASESSWPTAFANYSDARRARAERVVAAANRNGRIYHLAGLAAAARNLTLRLTPPRLVMAQYAWLYGKA